MLTLNFQEISLIISSIETEMYKTEDSLRKDKYKNRDPSDYDLQKKKDCEELLKKFNNMIVCYVSSDVDKEDEK